MLAVALARLGEQALIVGVQLLAHDGVGILQDVQLLRVHIADDADGQARPREGLAVHNVVGQTERRAQRAHLVLEEMIQGLNQVEMHALREGNQIVVRLNRARLPAGLACAALDDVGVDGALGQVLHRTPVLSQVLRHGEELLPELRADDAALLLRVGHAAQKLQVALLGVHVDEVHVELLREHLFHFLGLALAQKAVVHEHAGQLLADGASAQGRHHGRVHAARKA